MYEYRVVTVDPKFVGTKAEKDMLQKLGETNWELVAVHYNSSIIFVAYYLKRRASGIVPA